MKDMKRYVLLLLLFLTVFAAMPRGANACPS